MEVINDQGKTSSTQSNMSQNKNKFQVDIQVTDTSAKD